MKNRFMSQLDEWINRSVFSSQSSKFASGIDYAVSDSPGGGTRTSRERGESRHGIGILEGVLGNPMSGSSKYEHIVGHRFPSANLDSQAQ